MTEHDVDAGAIIAVVVHVNEFRRFGVITDIAAPVEFIAIAFASTDAPSVSAREIRICDPETVAVVSCTVAVATTPSAIVLGIHPTSQHIWLTRKPDSIAQSFPQLLQPTQQPLIQTLRPMMDM